MVVFTLVLNKVHVFANFIINLDRGTWQGTEEHGRGKNKMPETYLKTRVVSPGSVNIAKTWIPSLPKVMFFQDRPSVQLYLQTNKYNRHTEK